ncbi:MAG TPA: hypothetical protein VFC79_02145 [Tissierellaceae bacterium]|nr:hypothetical protein [Tissierellaceae bacterium]
MNITVYNCKNDNTIYNTKNWIEYTDEIKKILVRSVAIKPKSCEYEALKRMGWKYQCSICNYALGINDNIYDYSEEEEFCPGCGQKLEWE